MLQRILPNENFAARSIESCITMKTGDAKSAYVSGADKRIMLTLIGSQGSALKNVPAMPEKLQKELKKQNSNNQIL